MAQSALSAEIAILGYGCRLPGAEDAEAFWRLLADGRCAVGRIGEDRWSSASFLHPDRGAVGASYSLDAGVLDDPFVFDAGFFGISPREAAQMDPQQRLLLLAAWEAVERSGLPPRRLAGPRTGVWVGASGLDYANSLMGDPSLSSSHFMTGNTLSIVSNRLAYVLDAQGPSYTLDTACSSSLFALHAGCEAIRRGEVDVAVVGGANLLLSPMPFVGFSRASMLSPTGRCRAFDAGADGYVRAEGAVVFVLSRLDLAREAGDPARGVILGSAVNSDGRQGLLTVPNGARQAALMRAVWDGIGVEPDDLAFVEAHGTGTPVGDPIEARAIGEALAAGRSRPLPIGSVKSNIGHLEPASGLAGLLKAQLALERGLYPASLHLERPNPAIPFEALKLAPAAEPAPLEAALGRPLAAGVNSFGFGGANAHVGLRLATEADRAPAPAAPAPAPLILTAATRTALAALAARWRDRLAAAEGPEAAALAAVAAHRRARHPHRLVVAAREPAAQAAALAAFAAGERPARAAEGVAASAEPAPVAFVFSGNGSQFAGMARGAFAGDAAFRASFEATAAAVSAAEGPDLVAELHTPDLGARLGEAIIAQPLLLAIQIAIVEALAERGVRPGAVAGHSIGEIAAAWTAGVLDREEAARLTVLRARRQAVLKGVGGMAAVLASAEAAEALIAANDFGAIAVAADNSPRGATVSGETAALGAFLAAARKARLATRRLAGVEIPFHGPALERIREGLLADLADLRPRAARVPFVSTVEGVPVAGEALDADYWWRNARQAVLFRQAALALAETGARVFLEIAPQPTLQNYVSDTLSAAGRSFTMLPSLRRSGADAEDLDVVAASVVAAGGAVDETALFGPETPHAATPPAYPFELATYRLTPAPDSVNLLRRDAGRGLLGWRAGGTEGAWRLTLDPVGQPWLADHAVDGAPAAPAAAFVEMALAAAAETLGDDAALELTDFDIARPLPFEPGARADLRVHYDPESGLLRVESRRLGSDDPWTRHASGTVRRAPGPASAGPPPDAAEAAEGLDHDALYAALGASGLDYGPAFARVERAEVERAADRARGRLRPSRLAPDRVWTLDPTSLDAAFHLLAPLIGEVSDGLAYVPVRIGRLRTDPQAGAAVAAEARLRRRGARSLEAEVALLDAEGRRAAALEGVRFAAIRLRRAPEAEALFWRETRRALREPGEDLSAGVWSQPAERLAALGLTAGAPPEPDAGALILDAVCRRVAWEAARAIAPEGGVRFGARRSLDARGAAALSLALDALAADGAYDPATDAASRAPAGPPLPELARALTLAAPDRVEALTAALRLRRALEPGAASGAEARPPATEDWRTAPLWAALLAAGRDAATARKDGPPLRALLVGAGAEAAAETLRRAGAEARGVSDPAGLAGKAEDEPAELILALGLDRAETPALRRLVQAAAPGAPLLAAERRPELLHAMLEALEGARPAAEPLAVRLAAAGFAGAVAAPAAAAEAAFDIVAARAPASAARAAPEAAPRLALRAPEDRAGAAFAAALEDALLGARATLDPEAAEIVLFGPAAGEAPEAAAAAGLDALRAALRGAPRPERLWLVLRAGGAADAALARGLRALANERPETELRAVEIAPGDPAAPARLARAILARGPERELSLAGRPSAPRVEAAPEVVRRAALARIGAEPALRLEAAPLGGLETLRWRPAPRRAPEAGEVEIAVEAAGLNFRDVMWAAGALPEEAIERGFAGTSLGMECAGRVARAGAGSGFREGERVVAFAPRAFATHVVVPAASAAPLPEEVAPAAAATLPVAFATAWRGLVDLGRLQAGETVLIHGGAGGVGLAALQIALARGARVFATAGTPEKRALLRLLGAEAAFDSRGLDFADEAMAATEGAGVDIVLNSLSGEAMERSLGCLGDFGRFIELGKRDFYAGSRIGLRPLRRNIAYHGVDLDALLALKPEAARPPLEALAAALAAGEAAPLPYRVFEADQAIDAFRLMQRAGHVGKIVLTPPEAPAAAEPAAPLAREDGAYLVMGGLRGFGLRFAERLAARGARRLWLAGASGRVPEAEAPRLAALRAAGVRVEVAACDAADEAQVAALLARIDAAGAPLRGVAHTAARLDDALIENLDRARMAAVLRPKLGGAAVLDRLTRGRALDHFVLFSSVAATIGNPGQSAYAAANGGLERIAAARRAESLPGLAAAFGPIADAGMLAGDAEARERLERLGAGLLTSQAALDALETALEGQTPEAAGAAVVIAPMRWGALAPTLPLLSTPLFERIDRTAGAAAAAAGAASARALIEGMDEGRAVATLCDLLRAEAATILRLPPEKVDANRPIAELGFDSLMAVELKLAAEERFGVALPALSLSEGATLAALAARLVPALRGGEDAAGGTETEAADMESLLARHAPEEEARRIASRIVREREAAEATR